MNELTYPADISEDERLVLDQVMEGQTLTRACQNVGLKRAAFYLRMNSRPSLSDAYTRALEAMVECNLDKIDTVAYEVADVQQARLISDNLKWSVAKRMPKKYGDRLDVNVTSTVDLTSALLEARARVRPVSDPLDRIIDITPNESSTYTQSITDSVSDSRTMPDIFD